LLCTERPDLVSTTEIVLSLLIIASILEAARRSGGVPLFLVATCFFSSDVFDFEAQLIPEINKIDMQMTVNSPLNILVMSCFRFKTRFFCFKAISPIKANEVFYSFS